MDAGLTLLRRIALAATLMAATCGVGLAQTSSILYDPDSDDDNSEADVRERPEIDGTYDASISDDDIIVVPNYVRSHLGIEFNGADWRHLRDHLRSGDRKFNIVHIGDSHLQADIATQLTRELLQMDYGNGGRGLITPLRLSGTNEPWNYGFKSNISWSAEQFMKFPWSEMGFTGCAITARSPKGYIELSTSDKNDWNPFNAVTIFHSGDLGVVSVTDDSGCEQPFQLSANENSTTIHLSRGTRLARINIDSPQERLTIYGAYLEAGKPGLVYNVIGHNGATFQTYNRISHFGGDLSELRPDLVVVSLGCNEAFGKFNELSFTNQIDQLVKSIRSGNENVAILLTTPMECQRRVTTYTRARRRSRRRVAHTSFSVNSNVALVRDAINRYARKNGLAVYDFYSAAGGAGASAKWVADGLYSKDHIHLSGKGYKLQGKLLYDALSRALSDKD